MSDYTYYKLPINPDEGFPQAFQVNFNGRLYRFSLYANILAEQGDVPEDHVFDLPQAGGHLVLEIARQSAGSEQVILHRKLVKDHECPAAELMILFREMRVAKRNLNAAGTFGSAITGGVAARWD